MPNEITYRVPEAHHTETDKGAKKAIKGSVHHVEMREFNGLITRAHDDGTRDIVIFPPDKAPIHVHKVEEGRGPGTLSLVDGSKR